MEKKYVFILLLVIMAVFLISGICSAGIADDVKKYANTEAIKQEVDQMSDSTVNLVRQIAGTAAVVLLAIGFFFYKFANGDAQKLMKAKMAMGGMLACLVVVYKAELIVGGFLGLLNVKF